MQNILLELICWISCVECEQEQVVGAGVGLGAGEWQERVLVLVLVCDPDWRGCWCWCWGRSIRCSELCVLERGLLHGTSMCMYW